MHSHFFLHGLIIGISIAAPVGPIGILCIRRSLTQGQLSGFVSGLGAATADAVYGCVAAFGLTFISDALIEQKFLIRLVGVGSMGGDYLSAGLVVGGVFLGSATWWLTLSTLVSLFRKRFSVKSLRWVNRAAGAILCGFGVFALVGVFFEEHHYWYRGV
jgi:threonine/homoserine/homoserine lactone efflux protein